jgi:oligoribonuclease (3'-5' exoribonuclease)
MLIGCDLETTGLDECQEDILEIALVAIETPSFKIIDSYTAIVIPSEFCWAHVKNPQTDGQKYVRAMHEKSGLFQAIDEQGWIGHKVKDGEALKPRAMRHALPSEAEAEALAFVAKHMTGVDANGKPERSPMFGCNPRFDRAFLNVHMNALERKFHYRSLDVNALWLLREYLTGADPTREKAGTAHRALADCEQAVKNVHDHFEWMSLLLKAVA